MGKQMTIFLPLAQHLGFQVPATTFANQGHADQLAVAAARFGTGAIEKKTNLLPDIIHNNVHPQTKI
jgi:hypothetical protein